MVLNVGRGFLSSPPHPRPNIWHRLGTFLIVTAREGEDNAVGVWWVKASDEAKCPDAHSTALLKHRTQLVSSPDVGKLLQVKKLKGF